ncbi:MAG: hypothetical protein CUN53_16605, partial [Phototrophicales bacterium]
VPYIVDIHDSKWNKYVPMTGQEVISPHYFAALSQRGAHAPTLLIVNPRYEAEIRAQVASCGGRASFDVIDGEHAIAVCR